MLSNGSGFVVDVFLLNGTGLSFVRMGRRFIGRRGRIREWVEGYGEEETDRVNKIREKFVVFEIIDDFYIFYFIATSATRITTTST